MGMRKRIRWSANLAYVIGLIASDGTLSKDKRHIDFTSKDLDQIHNYAKILKLKNKIGIKRGGDYPLNICYRVEFGDVVFYKFLLKIGLTPNKSKSIGNLLIPHKYFIDFLRGSLDGDGYTYSYFDSKFPKSFRLYTGFVSASYKHLVWINLQIKKNCDIQGTIHYSKGAFKLVFAKKNSIILLNKIYYKSKLICLPRKHSKIVKALGIIAKQTCGCGEMVYAQP